MRTLIMPDHSIVAPGYKSGDVITDEQDIAYNQECNRLIKEALASEPEVKTHYPFDLPDGSSDDTVALDDNGEIFVVDAGAA